MTRTSVQSSSRRMSVGSVVKSRLGTSPDTSYRTPEKHACCSYSRALEWTCMARMMCRCCAMRENAANRRAWMVGQQAAAVRVGCAEAADGNPPHHAEALQESPQEEGLDLVQRERAQLPHLLWRRPPRRRCKDQEASDQPLIVSLSSVAASTAGSEAASERALVTVSHGVFVVGDVVRGLAPLV